MAESTPSWGTWLRSWVLIALGVLLAAWTNDGIRFESNGSLVFAVLLISLFNVFLRPVLVLFTLPFVVFTFGLGIVVINALLFWLAGSLVPGFEVTGFWPALWGAIVVGLTSLVVNVLLGGPRSRPGPPQGPCSKRDDDVIDV